ncbi:MAG: glycosyltransferase [Gemmatimonadetes bacterium]|nr:glycosyltransferase [Gemmatimonadota bacterium]
MNPEITAIICTRNRSDFLDRCVQSLLAQTLEIDRYRILIVDNGSTDATPQRCRVYLDERGIRSVHEPNIGLSQSRNTGWSEADTEFVGYIDDDAVADKDWLKNALQSFTSTDPAPDWVGGPIDLDCEQPLPGWIDAELQVPLGHVDYGTEPREITGAERLGGGNSFFRRDVLEGVGGFNPGLGRRGTSLLSAEETELQHRLRARGARLYYHPGVRVSHHVPLDRLQPRWFYRRYWWGGYSDAVMARALRGVQYVPVGGDVSKDSRFLRLVRNTGAAMSLSSDRAKQIHGRIYLAYVMGSIAGRIRG